MFAEGIAADKVAITAAVTETWSNGQTEGQVTKLKLVNARCTDAPRSICCALDWWRQAEGKQVCTQTDIFGSNRLTYHNHELSLRRPNVSISSK